MNKLNFKKIMYFSLIHFAEIVVLIIVSIGIMNSGPQTYRVPIVVLFVVIYLVYLANSIYEEYLSYKGGDFTV